MLVALKFPLISQVVEPTAVSLRSRVIVWLLGPAPSSLLNLPDQVNAPLGSTVDGERLRVIEVPTTMISFGVRITVKVQFS